MASGEKDLSILSLMSEFLTLLHHKIMSAYPCHEREKRYRYEQCVHEAEHGHFIPLVFTTIGEMGGAASQVYKSLANLLSEKLNLSYGEVMGWIRCKFSWLGQLLCASMMLVHRCIH